MSNSQITNTEWEDFRNIRKLFELTGIKPVVFLLPMLLSFLTAFFEGVSFGLLVPLIRGIFYSDFSFLWKYPAVAEFLNRIHWLQGSDVNRGIFIMLCGGIFLSVFLKNLSQYFSLHLLDSSAMRFADQLRRITFRRCLSFGKLFFDQTGLGALTQMIMANSQKLMSVLISSNATLASFLMLIAYLILMAKISWQLTLVSLCIFPLVEASTKWIITRIKNNSISLSKQRRILSDRAANIIMGIPLVKACAREEEENKQFSMLSEQVWRKEAFLSKKQRIMPFVQEMLVTLVFMILIFAAAYLSSRNYLHAANLLVFFVLLRRSLTTAGSFGRLKASLAEAHAPAKEILNLLQEQDHFIILQGDKAFQGLKKEIQFKNLNFSYLPSREILHGVNFSISKGQSTALVGRTGSGKTTLVHLLLRFYDCPAGSILMDGEDIRNFTHESLRKRMTFVGQDTILFNDTIRMNVTYGVDHKVSETEIMEALQKARLEELIHKLPQGLKTIIGDRGVQLSGGERQRLALARAMLRNTEILILDEPTSAMDSKTEAKIQEAMEEAMKGKTTIMIAHRLSTIRHVDKVVLLENGEVKEEGAFTDLLEKRAQFFDYWEHQSMRENFKREAS